MEALTGPGAPAADDPRAYLAGDRRRALATGQPLANRVQGAGLFADISGFTALTEALVRELGRQRGAEELTAVLDRVFDAVLERLHRHGGEVIYFSGDAVTCWLDGDDGLRALAAALGMRAALDEVGTVVTGSGSVVRLGMKIALAVGPARRFVVGDPDVQLMDVLAGSLVDELAAAESQASVGDVVLAPSAVAALTGRVVLGEQRIGATVLAEPAVPLPVGDPVAGDLPELDEDLVRQWLLPAVYERLSTGRGELLAELRPAVPLFLRFGGIDFDRSGAAVDLDAFIVRAQRIVDAYGGSTLQITLGDKGAYLYAVFGSPVAHEDDAARACAAALELRALDGETPARDLSIGIASGPLRSGTYGHSTRRTFVCLGDAVNVAARLMSRAGPGGIWVSDAVRRAASGAGASSDRPDRAAEDAGRFSWRALDAMALKGRAEQVRVHALVGLRQDGGGMGRRLAHRFDTPMLGRTAELAVTLDALADVRSGEGRVLEVVAEAGLGKTRLLAELAARAERLGVPVFAGETPAFGTGASYSAWRDVWWDLLDLGDLTRADLAAITARLTDVLTAADPALVGRLPLLGPLLDLALPDTDLTRGLDGKARKGSLEDLLSILLTRRAEQGPLVLVIEDSHWMDPLSADLLATLAAQCAALPVLICLAHRPGTAGEAEPVVGPLAHRRTVALTTLEPDVVRALAVERVVQSGRRCEAPQLIGRITDLAQGNPFYVEELVGFVLDRTSGDVTDDDLGALELPDSLASLVLSRIDMLAEGPRTSVRVASVIGRSFTAPLLHGVQPDLGGVDVVEADLDAARAADLVMLEDPALRRHAFRHVIVRDVAYESIPFAVRTRLHTRTGDALRATETGAGDQLLDLLAYHYARGGDEAKKRDALLTAATAAAARYANGTAIEHYRAVVPLLSGAERAEALRGLGQVLELTGEWGEAQQAYLDARELTTAAGDVAATAWADVALAEVARKQGRYGESAEHLDTAAAAFAAAGDEVGGGRVLHLRGTLEAQQGRYPQAREYYRASLAIRERLGDRANAAAVLSNLGVIAEYTEDYDQAQRLNEQALALRVALGDRAAVSVSRNNLGMLALLRQDYVAAHEQFAETRRLGLEIGDSWMSAIAEHNLANASRGLGDLPAACRAYLRALDAFRRWDDRWALAILLEDVALAAAALGRRAEGVRLVAAAGAVREELGSPRTPSVEAELARSLAPGGETSPGWIAAVTSGDRMSLQDAADLARDLCGRVHP